MSGAFGLGVEPIFYSTPDPDAVPWTRGYFHRLLLLKFVWFRLAATCVPLIGAFSSVADEP